jgi:hypothetical protein
MSLGDMRFMGRYGERGDLIDLLFIPEYPSGEFSSLRGAMTFYGVLLNQPAEEPFVEVRAWDLTYRYVDWATGISVLSGLDKATLTSAQVKMIKAIVELDESSRARAPNCTQTEMRRIVGAPTGARISLMPLAFGLV